MLNPGTGCSSITVIGRRFGLSDVSIRIRLGSSVSEAVAWISSSAVLCKFSSGSGLNFAAIASVGVQRSNATLSLSYALPGVSLLLVSNAARTGSTSLSVMGVRFGIVSVSQSVSFSGSSCESSRWISDSSANCKSLSGSRQAAVLLVTSALLRFSTAVTMSYDALLPVLVSSVRPAFTGSVMFTVIGRGFSSVLGSPRVSIGANPLPLISAARPLTASESASWLSDSAIVGKYVRGFGINQPVHVTNGAPRGSISFATSYAAPVPDFITANLTIPTSGSYLLTVFGSKFGSVDTTFRSLVGSSTSQNTVWRSDSELRIKSRLFIGVSQPLVVSTQLLAASSGNLLSASAPVLSSINFSHRATSGSYSVTMFGDGFGRFDVCPTSRIGGTACEASAWVSESSAVVRVAAGSFEGQSAVISVRRQAASWTQAISYAEPAPASVRLSRWSANGNIPVTGSQYVLSYGQNFGKSSDSPQLVVGGTRSESTSWNADTALFVKSSSGVSSNPVVAVSSASLSSLCSSSVSYDAASIGILEMIGRVPGSGATMITVSARALGTVGFSQRAQFISQASMSVWISDSSLLAKTAVCSGANSRVSVSVCSRVRSSVSALVTYSIPEVSSSTLGINPTSGSVSLTLYGLHFSLSMKAVIGATATESSVWMSGSSVICKISAGVGSGLLVSVSVARQPSASQVNVSYATHTLFETQTNTSLPTSGSIVLRVLGANLGTVGSSSTAWVDSTRTEYSMWNADSHIFLKVAAGVCRSCFVRINVMGAVVVLRYRFLHQWSPDSKEQMLRQPVLRQITSFKVANSELTWVRLNQD